MRHKLIPGSVQTRIHSGDPTILEDIIAAGKELEREGVRAIVGACGYLGHFQPQVAAALDVPVYLSSLLQVSLIKMGLKPGQKIGILCADAPALTPDLMKKAGILSPDDCIVAGLGDKPEFSGILHSNRGYFSNEAVRQEMITTATELVAAHPEIGAILLECSDMPPYSADVQRAVNLPVFDFITMINWVHQAVAQRAYEGFI